MISAILLFLFILLICSLAYTVVEDKKHIKKLEGIWTQVEFYQEEEKRKSTKENRAETEAFGGLKVFYTTGTLEWLDIGDRTDEFEVATIFVKDHGGIPTQYITMKADAFIKYIRGLKSAEETGEKE